MNKYLSLVKFEHTVFSFPLVVAGAVMAARGLPDWKTFALILTAAAGARTAAMALNRIIDSEIDGANPRTKNREIPSGAVSPQGAYLVAASGLAVYFVSAYLICPLALALSPAPVVVFAVYPYLKRITPLCHLGVGSALAFAPAGGWIAVRCSFDDIFAPLMLSVFTLFWVAGFDIIYSIQDEDFDRKNGLRSAAVSLGAGTALSVSTACHTVAVAALIMLQAREFGMNIFSIAALAAIVAVFALERMKAADTDLAFFKLNAAAGALVLVFTVCGIYLG